MQVIQGLETNTALKSLWLGRNKIEAISGLDTLVNLRQLDIQHNRLETLGDGLLHLSHLEELYLAWNNIPNLQGLPHPSSLNTVDLSKNQIATLEGVQQHTTLEELWLSYSLLSTFESLSPLSALTGLNCVYLEHSPIAKDYEYRKVITKLIPSLQQLDATQVNRTVV
jgi:Leucine-rich repeat (LRR) protein